ncbi:Phosphate-starvation-inducible E [Ferrithrix thermotolerans DSM 19514]|uniref:Phosphate-starvation-inducible E n=1 Tax=Ferrithrix thermotolerans DSM 19514 TaxID=1121881 RepID=A0A1M4UF49_9ACTN|nr:phosphate-starvation-inducible PsiE family protein [Ferrithrix thermotolerans]SHE55421.1 Phosphate-starvation-inducible E [Ferrithrix thermotolerans DSM 19514]
MSKISGIPGASQVLEFSEKIIYLVIAITLVVMSVISLISSTKALANVVVHGDVILGLTSVLNDILFVIILMELLGTVITHLSEGGFQLRPFLIIGIISSVRRVLVLGAQLSTTRRLSTVAFDHALIELGVDATIVVILTVSLFIIQKIRSQSTKKENETLYGELETKMGSQH